jgi:hypothetical protein
MQQLWKNQQHHWQTLLSIVLMDDVVDIICSIVYEIIIYEDNMVDKDILFKLCEEWEKLETKSTMTIDQKLI